MSYQSGRVELDAPPVAQSGSRVERETYAISRREYRRALATTWCGLSATTVIGVLMTVISGCKTLEPSHTDLSTASPQAPGAWSAGTVPGPVVGGWMHHLGDPKVAALAEEAIANNPDLQAAAARFAAAAAQFRLQATNEGLTVDFDALGRRRATPLGDGNQVITNSFDARLDAAWEADIWGRLSDLSQAAASNARASASDYAAARLSLAANTAQAWFSAVAARLQFDLAQDTVNNFQQNLAIVEEGFRAGLNAALDVRLERANLAGARSRLEARRVDLDRAVRGLEVLLGRYPAGELEVVEKMPALQSNVPAGLPVDLLARRPDIRAAARRIEATDRRQDAARKARLPQIRLTASGGFSSGELRDLLDFDALLWTLATGVVAPIVDSGRIDAQVALEEARGDETLANYTGVVLQAFLEVETALAAEAILVRQEAALTDAERESSLAEELALERYRRGLVDIVTWLEARRRAFDARSALITLNNQRLQNRVALLLALGGDFGAADYTSAILAGSPGWPGPYRSSKSGDPGGVDGTRRKP